MYKTINNKVGTIKQSNGLMKKVMSTSFSAAMLFAIPTIIVSQTAQAASAASNLAAARNLNTLLTNVNSMSADFTQTTSGARSSGARNGTFSGTMSLKRPNKFRWNITSPSEQLIVTNGSTLWVYDKDLEQVTRQNADNQIGNTPALLLSGNPNRIANNFRISQPDSSKNYYVLHPKSSSSNFNSLSISFNRGKPVMMVLNDSLGQVTSIRFNNIRLNTSISNNQFNFTPPTGVDVIDQ